MANPGVILLIVTTIVVTVIVIILLIVAATSFATENHNENNSKGATAQQSCSNQVNISDLIQIPTSGADCLYLGNTGTLYYIGNLENSTYDYVVAPWATSPFDVCIGYCTGYVGSTGRTGGTCVGPTSKGRSAQDNFNLCMSQLNSTTCIPPFPLAAKETFVYYAYSPTHFVCLPP